MRGRTVRTHETEEKFLKSLRRYGNVSKAARAARIGRVTAYEWRDEDEAFAKAWDDALDEAADHLEQEAYRRSVTGVLEPVYYQGEQVGAVRKYSDSLLTLLLKANRPEKFKDRVANEHSGDVTVRVVYDDT